MIIPFDKSSKVFDEKPFITEEITFNLMHFIREAEDPILMRSENSNIIIAEGPKQYPVWIWTYEGIGEHDYKVLADDFFSLFNDRTKLELVAKPSIAQFLANDYATRKKITWKTDLCMESYCCPKVICSDNVEGESCKAKLENLELISEFFAGFINDCFGAETTPDKQVETARMFIQSENLYIWNVENEIVSMANIAHRSPRHARLNEVYTVPAHRMNGYAGALVGDLCKIINSENRVPMLYTDLSNPASNKAYMKVGFVESGKVNKVKFIFD